MSVPEASFSVRVDPANPGQFFASCGLLTLSHRLWPGAAGWFTGGKFHLASGDSACGVRPILEKLARTAIVPGNQRGEKTTRPVELVDLSMVLDWWLDPGDGTDAGKSRFKMWAGQQTAAGIVEQLRDPLLALLDDESAVGEGLFNQSAPLSGRFGFDPRSAWKALDAGFSPNEQGLAVATFFVTELLAGIGMQACRPVHLGRRKFAYATWHVPLPPPLHAPATRGDLPIPHDLWAFEIVSRGSYKGLSNTQPKEKTSDG